ncbi:triose-phosphate isomerase [Nitrogeniibacter mangrovi]|uniref:Triosephosphate isomerase n=1 Tax=Nitrogeniibacter mangrovi TaxID=2016596 RepID=A0A6C1B622_9RHOO|nr:triose-phosphate isomerase [Nitrogeniibacter mangrovi]QID17694.1 triose-phosphate isomerase [Nitrogeniibacter mangrovi]
MSGQNKLVVGNWKMHGRRQMAGALVRDIAEGIPSGVDAALCVPFPYLEMVSGLVNGTALAVGAQDVSDCDDGAFTGEVSVGMLAEFGCRYVIVGHSERRARHQESSERVAAKAAQALRGGLVPIVCVGEQLEEREQGRTLDVISAQLAPVLALGSEALQALVVAYEPVWAIGTGLSASVAQAAEVHGAMRAALREVAGSSADGIRLLYGGSVKPETAADLFDGENIDGGLIGGASLKADDFLAICQAAI